MTPLRQRMTEDMGVRNLSPLTIKLYIDAVVKFSKFFYKSPALLGPEEVRTYQLYLINQKKASWSAFNIAVSALRFLYAVTLKTDWAFEKIPYAHGAIGCRISPEPSSRTIRRPMRSSWQA